jgi:drug/metabolite transporter (DMT)-like permease
MHYKKLFTGGAFIMFLGSILFSIKAIIVKICYRYNIDSASLLSLRMLFSLPFFISVALYHNYKNRNEEKTKLTSGDWLKISFLGIIGYYLASIFDFEGLKYISAGTERLILFIYPTIVLVITLFRNKRNIYKHELTALLLTYSGVSLVYFHELSPNNNNQILIGGILILFSAITYAIYLVGSGDLIPKIGVIYYTTYAMIVSTIAITIHHYLLTTKSLLSFPLELYAMVLFMAIFSTVIPGYMVSWSIKKIGASNSAIIASVGPVSTIVLAYFFLDENFTLYQFIGTIMVISGVIIVGSRKK